MKGITGIGYEYVHTLLCFTQNGNVLSIVQKLKLG